MSAILSTAGAWGESARQGLLRRCREQARTILPFARFGDVVRYAPQVTGALHSDGGDGIERCAFCSADAAGPCASCRRSVCGDCCVLTEGGAQTWAICLGCDRKQGRSLRGRWSSFGLWLVGLLVAMAAIIALLEWLAPSNR